MNDRLAIRKAQIRPLRWVRWHFDVDNADE